MARLRACMLVWALSEAMCTKWRMRNSRVLQRGPGSEVRGRGRCKTSQERERGLGLWKDWVCKQGWAWGGACAPVVWGGKFSKHL